MSARFERLPSKRPPRLQRGVALLEALIATVILAIGLLGAIGMQARAYTALSEAGLRGEATMASEKLLALMTMDQANLASYAYAGSGGNDTLASWLAETRGFIPNAAVKVAVTAETVNRSKVEVEISWQRKQDITANVHKVTSYISNSR